MSDGLRVFGIAWVLTQAASLIMLRIGARYAGHRHLLRLGQVAHDRKLRALDWMWPLTRLRAAVTRGDTRAATVILASLIALKSAASAVFGIIMVFWLPLASLFVPAIVALHDPADPTLGAWAGTVGALQVTSHALAAALGFAMVVAGPFAGVPIASALAANGLLVAVVAAASLGFAIAAGRHEAAGVVRRGL